MKQVTHQWRYPVVALLSAVTIALAAPLAVHANPDQGMHRGGSRGGGMHDFAGHALHSLQRHAKELGLSEEQTTKLKSLALDYKKARIREKADWKLAEVEVRSLMHDEKADLPAIESAMKKSEAAHTALRLESVKAIRTATSLLTPEQREKWRSTRLAMHHRGGMRHGEGMRQSEEQNGPRNDGYSAEGPEKPVELSRQIAQ